MEAVVAGSIGCVFVGFNLYKYLDTEEDVITVVHLSDHSGGVSRRLVCV